MRSRSPILLAEDDADEIELLRLAFKKAGLKNPVFSVADGEECLQYFRGEGQYSNREKFPLPQVLMLDLKLPGLGGFEVLEWLRAQPQFKQLTVIMLTGSTFEKDIQRAYAAGANSFLPKSLGLAGLVAQIKGIVDFWGHQL